MLDEGRFYSDKTNELNFKRYIYIYYSMCHIMMYTVHCTENQNSTRETSTCTHLAIH